MITTARYGISQDGVVSLKALARNLLTNANNVFEASTVLEQKVASINEGLGIYADEIEHIIQQNRIILNRNREDIVGLARSVNSKANDVQNLLTLGLGELSSNSTSNSYSENAGTSNFCSYQGQQGVSGDGDTRLGTSTEKSGKKYSSVDDLPDDIYYAARDYQENCWDNYNIPIRSGQTNRKIEQLRSMIHEHVLTEDSKFTRCATLKDLGNLASLPLGELPGKTYTFEGIMSTSPYGKGQGLGDVVYEVSAGRGVCALDLTDVPSFYEAMFDSPTCYIERVEIVGHNTPHIYIRIG